MDEVTIRSVRNRLSTIDADLLFHFNHLPDIVEKLGSLPDVALAYCFSALEFGHRRILYAGLMRKYRLNSELSWNAVIGHDIKRGDYPQIYASIFGNPIPTSTLSIIKPAEKIRDKMIHGKGPSTKQIWGAVITCLEYADAFNQETRTTEGFAGFGRMQGITGAKGKPTLPKDVSKLALTGLGFFKKL